MSAADWESVGPAECDEPQLAEQLDVVLRIEIRVDDADDLEAALRWVKQDAAALVRSGSTGVRDAQWCGGAARISIARLP